MALYEPSHLDLHCLQRFMYWDERVKFFIFRMPMVLWVSQKKVFRQNQLLLLKIM